MQRQVQSQRPPAPGRRPILCGVEPVGQSSAASVAADLAERLGTGLVLVLVKPPPSIATAGMATQMEMLHNHAVEHGRSVLAGIASDLADSSVGRAVDEAEGRVEFGEPAPRLAAAADELDANLIVIGSRGRGPAGAALLGSVSQDLAAAQTRPVLVVPPQAEPGRGHPPGCIVCGVDDSPRAASAVRVSGRLARSLGVRLLLVHVDESGMEQRLLELTGAAARPTPIPRWLRRLERVARAGSARVDSCVATGDPAEALEAVAVRESAALVAVGTRGHGALRSLALGSVSRGLASSCSRPVLVVDEPHRESADS